MLDSLGRQVGLIDASGNQTTFLYDRLGRLIEQIDPLGESTTFAFDALGRQTSRTDRDGRRIDYTYDALDRNVGETWYDADGTTVNNRVTFTYDDVGDKLTAADQNGAYTFTYDAVKAEKGSGVDIRLFIYFDSRPLFCPSPGTRVPGGKAR